MNNTQIRYRSALKHTVSLALAAGLLLAGLTTAAAPDPKATDTELAWQRYWKNYARRCIKMRENYFTCATFDVGFPSSRGVTTTALRQKTAREITERFGSNAKVKKVVVRPNEEIDAMAKTLPEVAIGQYGYIHSAEILDILGPDEMVVGDIWVVSATQLAAEREKEEEKLIKAGVEKGDVDDALDWMFETREELVEKQRDKTFRRPVMLRGFSTVGLAKGERWTGKAADKGGIQVAFVGEHTIEPTGKSRRAITMPLAIPAELFSRGIADEKEFLALLKARGFTKEQFVALVQDERKINGTDEKLADAHIFSKLDGRKEEKPEDKAGTKPKERTRSNF